jgi:hypothetical protein
VTLREAFTPPIVVGDLCLRCGATLDPGRDFDNHGGCSRDPSKAEAEWAALARSESPSPAATPGDGLDHLPPATCYRFHASADPHLGVAGAVWLADVRRALLAATPGDGLDALREAALRVVEWDDGTRTGPRSAYNDDVRTLAALALSESPSPEGLTEARLAEAIDYVTKPDPSELRDPGIDWGREWYGTPRELANEIAARLRSSADSGTP